LNEGTIVTIISSGPSEYLDGLAAAIRAKNAGPARVHCDAISGRIRSEYLRRREPLDLSSVPIIVDVLYGNAWLAKHLVLAADCTLALSCAAWSGGKLDEDQFSVVRHSLRRMKDVDVEVLTLLVPPRLTKVERALVRAVPAALGEIHVKGPSVSWTAAGIATRWDEPSKGKDSLAYVPNIKDVVPFYENYQQYTTMQQQQLQQNDTKQQQQQQQYQDAHTQQQQQQMQQQEGQQQVQQQMELNQEQVQQQQQQYQNADGQQDQHQFQDRHAADTAQQHDSGMFWDDLDGGLVFRQFERERYASVLEKIDFEALDATQSVKELVRLRERLLTIGLP
jgi:hypothetical protein